MKKSLICMMAVAFLFAGGLSQSEDICWAAQQSFTVTVPERGPLPERLPIARVKITLEFSQSAENSTLQVDKNTQAYPPFSHNRLFESENGAGNLYLFDVGPTSNSVTIDLILAANFENSGDYYNVKTGAAFPQEIAFIFDGPPIIGYKLSSYCALSATAKGIITRRIDNNPAFWKAGFAPPGTNEGRHGLDVVLVLDKSGSMGSQAPLALQGSTGETKWNILKTSAKAFVDAWEADDPIGSENDRLGVILFETTPDVVQVDGDFLVPRDNWTSLGPQIDSRRSGSCCTSFGDAIRKALQLWGDDPHSQDLSIVLMTDGLQNTGNLIVLNQDPRFAPNLWALKGPEPDDPVAPLISYGVPIQTIGVGAAEDLQSDLLDGIATQTGGKAQIKTASSMDLAFINTLVEILKGNTLELVTQQESSIAQGADASQPLSIDLGVSVSRAIMVLTWFGQNNAKALHLDIIPPGSTTPVEPKFGRADSFSTVQAVDLPASGPAGPWIVKVRRAATGGGPIQYHLSVLARDGRFAYALEFAHPELSTGEPVILRADLCENGQPLAKLANALRVRVERPQSALGTLLRSFKVSADILNTNPHGFVSDGFPSPYSRKLFDLFNSPTSSKNIGSVEDSRTFYMFDDGKAEHGDSKAGDGVYSMRFDETTVPGIYRFDVTLDFTSASLGHVQRVEQREAIVRVKPDNSETEMTASTKSDGSYEIVVVPADRYENFLGPGYADRLAISTSGGGKFDPVKDVNENGTYITRLVPAHVVSNPIITASFDGNVIKKGPLDSLIQAPRKFALFADIGIDAPHGKLSFQQKVGFAGQIGLEYLFTSKYSVEGILGYQGFTGSSGVPGVKLYRGAVNFGYYPIIGTYQLAIFGGGGVYKSDPGTADFGLNIGPMAEYRITTELGIEAVYNYHNVFTAGSATKFSTVQLGIRYRF